MNKPQHPLSRAAHRTLPATTPETAGLLDCDYFTTGRCHSCTDITVPYPEQVAKKVARAHELIPARVWEEPFISEIEGYRNKVKLVVTGTANRPKLGILGAGGGVDLRDCPLPSTGIRGAIPPIARFITACGLDPYSPATDHGTLKYVIITESFDGELMVRFVARRRGVQGILFKRRAELLREVPNIRVVSLNVQPERKAIIEGEEEILITDHGVLPMRLGGELTLNVRPQSFFQTQTECAAHLYTTAAEWLENVDSAWDLYCGVGGFAMALAQLGNASKVIGVEVSEQAVEAARVAARDLPGVAFVAADVSEWISEQGEERPGAVVVNPPRRGISPELCAWLNESGPDYVLYSSCNAETLARDVAAMPAYRVERAQVADMFPHTKHFETLVLLKR